MTPCGRGAPGRAGDLSGDLSGPDRQPAVLTRPSPPPHRPGTPRRPTVPGLEPPSPLRPPGVRRGPRRHPGGARRSRPSRPPSARRATGPWAPAGRRGRRRSPGRRDVRLVTIDPPGAGTSTRPTEPSGGGAATGSTTPSPTWPRSCPAGGALDSRVVPRRHALYLPDGRAPLYPAGAGRGRPACCPRSTARRCCGPSTWTSGGVVAGSPSGGPRCSRRQLTTATCRPRSTTARRPRRWRCSRGRPAARGQGGRGAASASTCRPARGPGGGRHLELRYDGPLCRWAGTSRSRCSPAWSPPSSCWTPASGSSAPCRRPARTCSPSCGPAPAPSTSTGRWASIPRLRARPRPARPAEAALTPRPLGSCGRVLRDVRRHGARPALHRRHRLAVRPRHRACVASPTASPTVVLAVAGGRRRQAGRSTRCRPPADGQGPPRRRALERAVVDFVEAAVLAPTSAPSSGHGHQRRPRPGHRCSSATRRCWRRSTCATPTAEGQDGAEGRGRRRRPRPRYRSAPAPRAVDLPPAPSPSPHLTPSSSRNGRFRNLPFLLRNEVRRG